MIKYIGFGGNHGTGKSTLMDAVQEHIENNYPDTNVYRISFGDALRSQAEFALPDGDTLEKQKKHPLERQLLQLVGERFRAGDKNWWTQIYLEQATGNEPDELCIILTDDVYHLNEAFLMDKLYLFRDYTVPEATTEDGYVPQSILETQTLFEIAACNIIPGWTVFGHQDLKGVAASHKKRILNDIDTLLVEA